MTKTRILSLILVLVMIVSCLASCSFGGGGGNEGEGEGEGEQNAPVQGESGENDEGRFGDKDHETAEDWWDSISYETTDLIFQMTLCSNYEELPSGCERYLSGFKANGESASESQYIDELVEKRNDAAYSTTNVNVDYRYYEDNASLYGFSKCFDVIFSEVTNATSTSPDMYCNFMTDMLVTSLKGSFANLYSTQHGTGDYAHKNYFDLKDKGYMADLMGSLTLNPNKAYVIASDYFLDLIRAFFIVPVNVSLYNQIAPEMIDDLNGDGAKDIGDIFEEAWAGDWTYDRLAEYSAKIYNNTDTVAGDSIMDVLGFGLGINGLPAAGLVYTSSVKVINKEWNEATSSYTYGYPDDNEALVNLANAVAALVNKPGVAIVTDGDAGTVGEPTPLLSIRNRFTNNKMLFGGIILVGSLEYESYQSMKSNGGFGVLPVPLYAKTMNDSGEQDMYLTQIHVVGRAGGISSKTTKFVQCSAFLQYQSISSTDILNEYYDYNLTYDTASGVDGNVEMLKYIRENVRTSFDKLYEDAIGFLAPDGTVLEESTRWHSLICDGQYHVTNMRDLYKTYVGPKGTSLANLVGQYDTLPS